MIIPAFYWATTRTAGKLMGCPECTGQPHRGWIGLSRGEGGTGMRRCPARCNRGYMFYDFDKNHHYLPKSQENADGVFGIAERMLANGAGFRDVASVVGGRRPGNNGGRIANKDDSTIGAGAAAVSGVVVGDS